MRGTLGSRQHTPRQGVIVYIGLGTLILIIILLILIF
jgi:hypothetical protein